MEEDPAMSKDKLEKKEDASRELKVIGAGLSRTGTLSTRYTMYTKLCILYINRLALNEAKQNN